MAEQTWTWLYTRGKESIRIVADDQQLVVYGPGVDERAQPVDGEDDALLQHTLIEQRLILGGWTLDRLITERRSGRERRDDVRPSQERRRRLGEETPPD